MVQHKLMYLNFELNTLNFVG